LGINMPARTAVFDGLERFDGKTMIPLPAREFMQMAGRAGRRGMDEACLVVARCDIEEWPAMEPRLRRYIEGHTEPVQSKFGLSFNSVVNLLNRQDPTQIRTLVERSFLAWHRSARAREDARKADALFAKLAEAGWTLGDKPPTGMKALFKDWKLVRGRADTGPAQTWAEFEERVDFLKSWGYIAQDGSFNAGAKAVLQLQISEIFVAECFLAGIFDEIDEETLFGVAAGMCAEFPRGANPKPDRRDKGLVRQLDQVRESDIVRQAEELTGVKVSWDPQMIPFGRAWAQGRSLAELMERIDSSTDVSGDLIGAFRRARDVVGQVSALYDHDPDKKKALDDVCRKVRRDEVEVVD
jgi:superfamily II RNA helicase